MHLTLGRAREGGGVGIRFFLNLSKTIFHRHLPFSVAVRLSLRHILKGRVYGLAHAHESKCCFFACARCRVGNCKQYYFITLLKNQSEASRLLLPKFRV